jgi:6-phosphofructokinase 1
VHKVQEAIEETLKLDCRITVLGHVQRGGIPSAIDRYSATIQGCRAVQVIKNVTNKTAYLVGMFGNKTIEVDLAECVKKVHSQFI